MAHNSESPTKEPTAYYPDLPNPTTDDGLEDLLSTIAERAVGCGLDNAHDMCADEQFIAAHVGTSIPGYVQVELDHITELGVFNGTEDRQSGEAALRKAAYLAFRNAVTEAAREYARENGYTVYERAAPDGDEETPAVVVGPTDTVQVPYPDDDTAYNALLAVLAKETLSWARNDANGPRETQGDYAAVTYPEYVGNVLQSRAPAAVPNDVMPAGHAPDRIADGIDTPADAIDLAQWRVLATAIVETVAEVADQQGTTVYRPRDD